MTSRNRLLQGLSALAVLAVATACSSSGSGASPNGPASSTVAAADTAGGPAPSGSAIKVGLICSCSGPFGATQSAGRDVGKAWAQSVNAAGGIAGHPVEITYVDDKADPGTSVTVAQQLISAKVAVILDNSYLDSTWAKAAAAAKIPVVGGIFNLADYTTNPYFFPSGQTENFAIDSVAQIAQQAGAKRIANFYCAEAPVCQEYVGLLKTASEKVGAKQVFSASVAATGVNYSAQCVAAKQAGADSIFLTGSADSNSRMAADCQRQDYGPIYLMQGAAYSDSMASAPGMGNKLWLSYPILPYWTDNPAVQKMRDAVDKYFPSLRKSAAWSNIAVQMWTGGLLIERAVHNSGAGAETNIDSDTVLKGLGLVKNETLDGWSPPLTFTPGKPHSVNCFFGAHLVDGKPQLLNDAKPICPAAS